MLKNGKLRLYHLLLTNGADRVHRNASLAYPEGHITGTPENLPLPAECSNALQLIYNVQDMKSVLRLKWAEKMIEIQLSVLGWNLIQD
jgi:hypothetical protein